MTSESVYDYIEYANSWPIGLPDILDSNLGPITPPIIPAKPCVCPLLFLEAENMLKVKHDVSHFRVPAVEMCNELFFNIYYDN